MPALPIDEVLPAVREALATGGSLVLIAPPGAGKTTRTPLDLLDQPWLAGRSILMLEPRRLAARTAAARMAELLGEPVGRRVGYRVRFDSRVSAATQVEVLTEGILTRRLQSDPELAGVGLVIFDEFHERSLHADLALALCKEARDGLREDLKILVMSATLDGAAVARLLDGAPVVESAGRGYPVTVRYLPAEPSGPVAATVARAAREALDRHTGDILAFLPGGAEIRRAQALLDAAAPSDTLILPLYGDLSQEAQHQAIRPDPQGRRKVVLATPIAETSLTIEGVSVVVDGGLARVPRFEPSCGLTRLDTVRISLDSAEQRAGRAGRLGPGQCLRLWTESSHRTLAPRRTPEILEADLAPLALELARWGVDDPAALAWLDPPPAAALAQARELLIQLDALDSQGRITATGHGLAELPLHPRLAHMLRQGAALGLAGAAADLAALLEERDILTGPQRTADLERRLAALAAFRRDGRGAARNLDADPAACARVTRAARQYRALIKAGQDTPTPDGVGLLLALAYPDRIAQVREGDPHRYRLAQGRGARLLPGDPLVGSPWLVAAHLDARVGQAGAEGRIYLAAKVNPADLETHLAGAVTEGASVAWDSRRQAVEARWSRRIGCLDLTGRALVDPDSEALRRAMVAGIRQLGLDCLPWTRETRDWRARVLCLRHWLPGEDWPDLSDATLAATLEAWLEPWLDGLSRREHLSRLDLGALLKSRLDWRRQTRLEALAPTHLTVPSGSRIRLRYQPGEAPVLEVKLQEMFGLADTPRLADGRVAVTLHLLSPARRPIQVTQDLRGFWERTYPEVKKELKGRYPKHPWPDDPWTATPTRRVKPRS